MFAEGSPHLSVCNSSTYVLQTHPRLDLHFCKALYPMIEVIPVAVWTLCNTADKSHGHCADWKTWVARLWLIYLHVRKECPMILRSSFLLRMLTPLNGKLATATAEAICDSQVPRLEFRLNQKLAPSKLRFTGSRHIWYLGPFGPGPILGLGQFESQTAPAMCLIMSFVCFQFELWVVASSWNHDIAS